MTNYTFDEIHQQPAMWRKELQTLLKNKAEVSAFMHKYLTPDTDVVLLVLHVREIVLRVWQL